MSAAAVPAVAEGVERCDRVLRVLFGEPEAREFSVRYWDGRETPASGRPRFVLHLRHPGALRRMVMPPSELRLGEAFVRGDFDVEGDLEAAAAVGDVGNDFYALWLDPRIVYSCGYFPSGTESLAEAQAAKLEHVCRKLRLKRDDRLLDIGCGWGALVEWAGTHHHARAFGITLSEPQAQRADERLFDAHLVGRCGVSVLDYRQLGPPHEYGRIASIGMVEHVGRTRLDQYFHVAHSVLRPGGLFLLQGIVAAPAGQEPGLAAALGRRIWQGGEFIDRYVFPDGDLVTLGEMVAAAEGAGFEVRDIESLREHYVRTLRCLVQRLESNEHAAIALVGQETYRTWRLYMAASAHAFASGWLNVVQIVLAKRDARGMVEVPLSRADLYRPPAPSNAEAV